MTMPQGHEDISFAPIAVQYAANPWQRNFLSEQVADCLFPCANESNGCKGLYSRSNKASHEARCDYREIYCPSPVVDCKWQGAYNCITQPFTSYHKDVMTSEGEDIIFLAVGATNDETDEPRYWITFQSCHGEVFLLTLSKHQAMGIQFYITVQLLGPRKKLKTSYIAWS